MGIAFIVLGILLFIFNGLFFIGLNVIVKNETHWNDFYKKFEDSGTPISEEEVYNLTCKIKNIVAILILVSIGVIGFGIALVNAAR